MRHLLLALATALPLVHGVVPAQYEWANVKTWKGTVTIEATDLLKREGLDATTTYRATGDVTLTDDAMPAGAHMQWPMPSPEAFSDPAKAAAILAGWQARVVAKYEAKAVNEMGQPYAVSCAAENAEAAGVSLAVKPTEPTYVVTVSAPAAQFSCTGPSGVRPSNNLRQVTFQLTGQRGAAGPISGTQTFTAGTSTIKVSYKLAPSK